MENAAGSARNAREELRRVYDAQQSLLSLDTRDAATLTQRKAELADRSFKTSQSKGFLEGGVGDENGVTYADPRVGHAETVLEGLHKGDVPKQTDQINAARADLPREHWEKFDAAVAQWANVNRLFEDAIDRQKDTTVADAARDPNGLKAQGQQALEIANGSQRHFSDFLLHTTDVDGVASINEARKTALHAQLDPVLSTFDKADEPTKKAAQSVVDKIKSLLSDTDSALDKAKENLHKYQLDQARGEASLAGTILAGLNAQLSSPDITANKAEALRPQIVGELRKQRGLKLQSLDTDGRAPAEVEAQRADINQQSNEEVAQANRRVDQIVAKLGEAGDAFGEWAKSFDADISVIRTNLSAGLAEASNPERVLKDRQEAATRSYDRGDISKVQLDAAHMSDGGSTHQAVLSGRVDQYGQVIDALQSKIGSGAEEYATLAQQRDGLLAVAPADRTEGQQTLLKQLDAHMSDVAAKIEKASALADKLSIEQLDAQQQLVALSQRAAPASFGEGAGMARDQYNDQYKTGQSMTSFGIDAIPPVLNSATSSLSTFFTTMEKGAANGKQAFQQLAASILKSMQEVLNNKLASMLISSGMNGLSSLFGGGGGATAAGGSSATAEADVASGAAEYMASGGIVYPKRAASGDVVGMPTRDSVPYLLEPGEGVLKQSAMSLLGNDTVNSLNSLGNRRISAASPAAPMSAPPVTQTANVYVVAPNEQPAGLGPSDVVAVITKDMMQGGATRKLIKQIQQGTA